MKYFLYVLLIASSVPLCAQDWPIYKGNIYFTGNNDEIVVKNANLKWLYQAGDKSFNPVVSDGAVYFLDQKNLVYCLDEEYGKARWVVDMKEVASVFKASSKSAGKVKYPLISGESVFLSDPIALYALNKRSGKVLWARTGMRTADLDKPAQGLSGRKALPIVDGIYADPVISGDSIYYGTRTVFLSRDTRNGHDAWENREIKTWSAYPTFYDDSIITQSYDMTTQRFEIHRLDASTGKASWTKELEKPQRIFPPVVYEKKVFVPLSTSIACLDYATGDLLWKKEYGKYITSNPSFTDRAVVFCLDNSDLLAVSPQDGSVISTISFGEKSGPLFVTIRDMVYAAYNVTSDVGGKSLQFGHVKAVNMATGSASWEFTAPFPGVVSQPLASRGSIIFPAGNYVYSIGTDYYPRTVQGGEGFAKVDGDGKPQVKPDTAAIEPAPDRQKPVQPKEPPLRPLELKITDEIGAPVRAAVEIRKWENGRLVYDRTDYPDRTGKVMVPEGDGVEITALADGHLPAKKKIAAKDPSAELTLQKIRKNQPYIVDAITFEYNQAYLTRGSLNVLDSVVQTMKRSPAMKLDIAGYTDSSGDAAYNQKLSERRADAVKEYMIKNGISPERLTSKGFGASKFVAPNDSDANMAKNRRTEFIFR
jgi:outer membrane protein OmpA-like peptidoglycan-associated protein/outer membrane protein assembly factor BamB